MVRWPRLCISAIASIEISPQDKIARAVLRHRPGDDPLIQEALSRVRRYGFKDSEVVFNITPDREFIDWWDNLEHRWRPAEEFEESTATQTWSNFVI